MERLVAWIAGPRAPGDPGPVVTARSLPPGAVWTIPDAPGDAWTAVGATVRALHEAPVPASAPAGDLRAALLARCDRALARARAAGLDPGDDGDALRDAVAAQAAPPERAVAVHGGLRASAVRRGPGGAVGLADWQAARIDDPWADLAAVAWMPPEVCAAFAAGYGPLPPRGPRRDAQAAGVAFDLLERALAAPPPARVGALALFRAASRALRAGAPLTAPALTAVRAEHLLARLIAAPARDLAGWAQWCAFAAALDAPPPAFEAFAASPFGPAAPLPAARSDWLAGLLADPLRTGVDLRLPFAAAVTRVGAAAGGLSPAAARHAGAVADGLVVAGPADPATTALYGTLAWGALATLTRHLPAQRGALGAARRLVDAHLADAADALGLTGWRLAGWAHDPAPLVALEGVPLAVLGPLAADAVRSGADAIPVAALLATLGVAPGRAEAVARGAR
jgi:hypothetical protein